MSIRTWLKEFYPDDRIGMVTAAQESPTAAVEHSLRKWQGLRAENLERHKLRTAGGNLMYRGSCVFKVSAYTCSCCERWWKADRTSDWCEGCPLVERNKNCCESGAFDAWLKINDPEPMIALLKRALKRAKRYDETTGTTISTQERTGPGLIIGQPRYRREAEAALMAAPEDF